MNFGRMGALSALIGAVVACSSEPGGGDGDCSLVGCNSQVRATFTTTLVDADAPTTKIVACRNDVCTEGTIAFAPASGYWVCNFPSVNGLLGPACEGKSLGTLTFTFGLENGVAKDGDRYSFKVLAKDGAVKGEKSAVATYKKLQPNGATCEPTCSQAEL